MLLLSPFGDIDFSLHFLGFSMILMYKHDCTVFKCLPRVQKVQKLSVAEFLRPLTL